jgi:hypothetical protein
MDVYDFRKTDLEIQTRIEEEANAAIEDRLLHKESPPKSELIPVGIFDGENLLPGCCILDDSYTVYMEVEMWN